MNRTLIAAVFAGGMLMMNSPEAAAHKTAHHAYSPPARYHVESHRAQHMPGWLWRDRAFRFWYRHTPLRHDHRIGWHGLYELFLWDQATARHRHYAGHDRDHHRGKHHRRRQHH